MSKRLMLGDQIDHLAADHAGGAGSGGECRDELAAHRRIAMRVGIGQHLEGSGQQAVAGEHRGRLVEFLVAGRAAAAQIAVVHRRQIVMDERIGVDHLDRRRHLQRATPRNTEQPRARQHEKRPQPFARRQRRVAHRFVDPRLEAGRHDQQPIERDIGQLRGLRQRLGEGNRVGPQRFSQVSPAPR